MTVLDDDLVRAASIEDDEDRRIREEEEKSAPEQKETPEVTPSEEAPEDEETPEEEAEPEKPDVQEKAEVEKPESEEPEKMTRKERREARKQAWLESVRKERLQQQPQEQAQPRQQQPQQEPYKPIDYRTVEEINEEQLEQDRRTYGEYNRRQGIDEGVRRATYVAEQEKFWMDVEHESTRLGYDPEFKFLDESNPDTFDPDMAADLNEKYLEFVGYNPQNSTVQRTDISYEKFVRKEMEDRKAYAERLAAESSALVEQTKANTGIRPGGGTTKSGLGTLKPGDISKMTDEELEKYDDEIDRQILSAF